MTFDGPQLILIVIVVKARDTPLPGGFVETEGVTSDTSGLEKSGKPSLLLLFSNHYSSGSLFHP